MSLNPNIRIAYRLLSSKILLEDPLGSQRVTKELEWVAHSTKFIVDNLVDYYIRCEETESYNTANWSPPWNRTFIEWNMKGIDLIKTSKKEEEIEETKEFYKSWHEMVQFGVLLNSYELNDANRTYLIENILGIPSSLSSSEHVARMNNALNQSKWFLTCTFWLVLEVNHGQPIALDTAYGLAVDSNGSCLKYMILGKNNPICSKMMLMVGYALSFCHCKNVEQQDKEIIVSRRFHENKNNPIPILTFKTLKIDTAKQHIKYEPSDDTSDKTKRALHICRGHFANYTEEAPLFGKLTGQFWIPDHVKGSEKSGRVIKNYKV